MGLPHRRMLLDRSLHLGSYGGGGGGITVLWQELLLEGQVGPIAAVMESSPFWAPQHLHGVQLPERRGARRGFGPRLRPRVVLL